jgi:hypothetical protein
MYRNICSQLRDSVINRTGKTPANPTAVGIRQFNGEWREGFQYALKNHSFSALSTLLPRIFYYNNTYILLNDGTAPGARRGMNAVPPTSFGGTADTWVKNNLYFKVNNATQGDTAAAKSYTGQVMDYDLYYHLNDQDSDGSLIDLYGTVPEFCAAEGLECHGLGGTVSRGTYPLFQNWEPLFDQSYSPRWKVQPYYDAPDANEFVIADVSPAVGAADPSHVDPRGGFLPDTRCASPYTDTACFDVGSIPHGQVFADSSQFPWNMAPKPRATRVRGVRLRGVRIR